MGIFRDTRSGSQRQKRDLHLGHFSTKKYESTYIFEYKYVIGYCRTKKGEGIGPTLELIVGNKLVWKKHINLKNADYPYDAKCGGGRHKYSPWNRNHFKIPANVGGKVVLKMIGTDRNIHVVGNGIKCFGKINN